MTDTPNSDHNTPAQVDDEEVLSHLPHGDEPDDFLNDAVSGSSTTSDEAPDQLGHANDVHPDLDLAGADITESEGPVIEGGDAGASTPSPDQATPSPDQV